MKSKGWKAPAPVIPVFAGIFIICQTLPPGGSAKGTAEYREAGKILIPHKSWPCGMAEGIPVPEHGVPMFEADLKLDRSYHVGRTPYGQRDVFVIQGGTLSGGRSTIV